MWCALSIRGWINYTTKMTRSVKRSAIILNLFAPIFEGKNNFLCVISFTPKYTFNLLSSSNSSHVPKLLFKGAISESPQISNSDSFNEDWILKSVQEFFLLFEKSNSFIWDFKKLGIWSRLLLLKNFVDFRSLINFITEKYQIN